MTESSFNTDYFKKHSNISGQNQPDTVKDQDNTNSAKESENYFNKDNDCKKKEEEKLDKLLDEARKNVKTAQTGLTSSEKSGLDSKLSVSKNNYSYFYMTLKYHQLLNIQEFYTMLQTLDSFLSKMNNMSFNTISDSDQFDSVNSYFRYNFLSAIGNLNVFLDKMLSDKPEINGQTSAIKEFNEGVNLNYSNQTAGDISLKSTEDHLQLAEADGFKTTQIDTDISAISSTLSDFEAVRSEVINYKQSLFNRIKALKGDKVISDDDAKQLLYTLQQIESQVDTGIANLKSGLENLNAARNTAYTKQTEIKKGDNTQKDTPEKDINLDLSSKNKNTIFEKIKNALMPDQKIIIDKSLESLYGIFAEDFGQENVFVDRREGDRRAQTDRRLEKDSNFFTEQREDTAGRRKSDRRSSEQLYINEDYIRKLMEDI